MNKFSPTHITAHPQFAASITQQPDQTNLTYTQDQVDSLSGIFLVVACLCVAAGSFYIGIGFGRRHKTRNEIIANRLRQIQTLERIWQMNAERGD